MAAEIELKVAEGLKNDVGYGKARISNAARQLLGLSPGDVVEVTGERTTAAVVWRCRPEDEGRSIVRIDGMTRRNAGCSLGDRVKIRPVEAPEARRVALAPQLREDDKVAFGEGIEGFIKRQLAKRPVVKGDLLVVQGLALMGNAIPFMVVQTAPGGVVRIGPDTVLVLREEPLLDPQLGPQVSYEDIGGLADEIRRVREMIELPLKHPELFERLGVEAPKGVLLHGPPGTGKTLIARAVAHESGAMFFPIQGPEIMSKFYGESEAQLRSRFQDAQTHAPSIVFIDEIDSIAPKRDDVHGEVERRVVAQLLSLMDGLLGRGKVVVIGATNRPNALDPALRRPGRFDREIEIGVPTAEGRLEILEVHTRGMPLAEDVDLPRLARITHGFVGADLASLTREAAMRALRRALPDLDLDRPVPISRLEAMTVAMDDFLEALREVAPSALREVVAEAPDVLWEDVGGLDAVKERLIEAVEVPLTEPERYRALGISPPRGVLLFGPSGSGKTLLVRALGGRGKAQFFQLRGPELLSRWMGETEKAVREAFRRARTCAPAILFLDDVDLLLGDPRYAPVRDQLLTSMDDLGPGSRVVVVGATARPHLLDPAVLRTGRLEVHIYVPPPSFADRLEVLKVLVRGMPLKAVPLPVLAERAVNYTGSDLAHLCREAGLSALRAGRTEVLRSDFEAAFASVPPSITEESLKYYNSVWRLLRQGLPRQGEIPQGYG